MSDQHYIIELEPGVFKAICPGDPGRVTARGYAQRFDTKHAAQISLGVARKYRPCRDAQILAIDQTETEPTEGDEEDV